LILLDIAETVAVAVRMAGMNVEELRKLPLTNWNWDDD
jgi:hypothetical protein